MPNLRRGPLCLYAEPERRNSVPTKPERRKHRKHRKASAFSQVKNEIEGVVDFVEYLNIYPDELFGL